MVLAQLTRLTENQNRNQTFKGDGRGVTETAMPLIWRHCCGESTSRCRCNRVQVFEASIIMSSTNRPLRLQVLKNTIRRKKGDRAIVSFCEMVDKQQTNRKFRSKENIIQGDIGNRLDSAGHRYRRTGVISNTNRRY